MTIFSTVVWRRIASEGFTDFLVESIFYFKEYNDSRLFCPWQVGFRDLLIVAVAESFRANSGCP